MHAGFPNLVQIAWLLFGLIMGAAQVTAAVLLLRDRGVGPWLMLAGATLGIIGNIGSRVAIMFIQTRGTVELATVVQIVGGIGSFGWLMFTAGLLIFALQRRALRARIDELERIADPGR